MALLAASSGSPALGPGALLAVPYADTRADDLAYALDLPLQRALRALELEVGAMRVDLRILGYSHQVVITEAGGSPVLTETVARLPGGHAGSEGRAALPGSHEEWRSGAAGRSKYSMRAEMSELAGRVAGIETLMAELDSAPDAVLGVFPGHPLAFTGLIAEAIPGGVRWRSWHSYPASNELVTTVSELAGERA